MTVRNLEDALRPRSVAVIGASDEPGSVGHTLTQNVLSGGFEGRVFLVNPHHGTIAGRDCFKSVEALPEAPELAVIATPPDSVPPIIEALGKKGTRATVVITAGFSAALKQAVLDAARPYCLRVIGPNCLGISVPALGLNANFGLNAPKSGSLAFLSQSGALMTGILDWASARDIGFSYVVSMGDMADVDVGDLLDFLAADVSTSAILLYLETIPAARKFMSAARSAARAKPVIAIKSGRNAAAAKAAATHTGALAGTDAAVSAAFRRAGLVRVEELEELFNAAETLATLQPIAGNELLIVTNGGGAGVLAVDNLMRLDGKLAPVGKDLVNALDKVLPANWSRANPIDIIGDASPERYKATLDAVLAEPNADGILVMNCPTALASSTDAAQAVLDAIAQAPHPRKVPPILTNWLGEDAVQEGRQKFRAAGIPTYESPNDAIQGFFYLWQYTKAQESLMRTPPKSTGHTTIADEAARSIMRTAVRAGRTLLTEPESKAVLSAFGIPTVATRVAASPEDVANIAHALLKQAESVVVKILSDDISHKSDIGGVRLGLRSPQEARHAAERMLARAAEACPQARIQGFTVQPMIVRKQAHELLLGVYEDPLFGPMILFGSGGTATEIINDTAVALPPLDSRLALDLMEQTRVCRLLEGYRDRPAADLAGIASALVQLSQLVVDCPAVKELDINPLIADETGVIALDARIRIDPDLVEKDGPNPRLAIRPYPNQWERWTETIDGERIMIRPIKPADEHLYADFVAKLSPEDIRFRFLAPRKEFSHKFIARFTQIDYARAMAFVALNKDETELYGIARLVADPDYTKGEYAIIVRSDRIGTGLGWLLMRNLIRYAEREGLQELTGDVLEQNTRMLEMCRALGFEISADPEDLSLRKVRLKLPVPIQDAA
ncbi:MAG: bifunctional acetate--CoA ligase family protein/GNAT family N-acetyltransferase [Methyloceanibacter sp.]|uniref:bifunctional acetate--CoA ligase family protein/GNAT family N-acetyltransferase n=1 Tax=Methyloceanibacter sp. TaxID=1965321 RepID=UPI003EE31FA6